MVAAGLIIAPATAAPTAPSCTWHAQTVDAPGDFPGESAMAADGADIARNEDGLVTGDLDGTSVVGQDGERGARIPVIYTCS
ncbi:hypothetical protein GCM10022223_11890 [Kineosporia mesophila]|uniref:Uncharacterized protein n=1 Tax=Kineosporia mesophila TaxID=566012 RepID=A0ABP6Z4Z6_9ACTN|nr:hypothetical protein [Kineosporia mesophila]MCD5352666.1 hypothetical protein [Kineosporia mesophila]